VSRNQADRLARSFMPALPGSSYRRFNVPLRPANKGNGKNLVTRYTSNSDRLLSACAARLPDCRSPSEAIRDRPNYKTTARQEVLSNRSASKGVRGSEFIYHRLSRCWVLRSNGTTILRGRSSHDARSIFPASFTWNSGSPPFEESRPGLKYQATGTIGILLV
jgi:hypothetical protein